MFFFVFFVYFFLCLLFHFCLTLYYYFIFLCSISLSLSFFFGFYLVSIYFRLLFFIYIIFVKRKKRKKQVKKCEKKKKNLNGFYNCLQFEEKNLSNSTKIINKMIKIRLSYYLINLILIFHQYFSQISSLKGSKWIFFNLILRVFLLFYVTAF